MARRAAPPGGTKKKTPAKKKTTAKKTSTAAEPKTRGPRKDYGYRPGCTIHVTDEEKKYRGKRGDVYKELIKCDGKPAEKFFERAQKIIGDDPARGWLRFYVMDGACELEGGEEKDAA